MSPRPSSKRTWILQPAWAASAAAAVVVGVVGTVAFLGGGSPSDPPLGGGSTPDPPTSPVSTTIPSAAVPIAGACVEQYDLETLAKRDFAFDGTVVSVNGDQVMFAVSLWFLGDQVTEVTLTATGLTGGEISSGGGVTLEGEVNSASGGLALVEGERYLVAGSGPFVWSCGFTQAYKAEVAADWGAVFGG